MAAEKMLISADDI
ncbi:hypothetical protein CGLO_17863 [Colletotrichum gloeosporioides Cg-14]|uniref:Uncharacterized protein n=1 Tax=Colletotrichum gloeosporioides (strain Cg-14) TaxID=1237896 RepID=T0JVU0_COLGC|nr:hypothetical protein CGLO_17863 [Colletotrichum gloeosporioides Cg-14]